MIWEQARSIAANVIILGIIVFAGILTISFIAGLYGIAWLNIADYLGFKGTVEDAIKNFGDPNSLLTWFQVWWNWFWGEVYKFLKWIYDSILGVTEGSHGSWGTVIIFEVRIWLQRHYLVLVQN